MKLKFLFSILAVFLFSAVTAPAQQSPANFKVEISLRENNFMTLGKNNFVAVKITNLSEHNLKTETLGSINLYLSKCVINERCAGRGGIFYTSAAIPSQILKNNESLAFEINPADLHWHDSISGYYDIKEPKNLSTVTFTNNYLSADVKIPNGLEQVDSTKVTRYKSFESNKIVLMLKASQVK